MFKLIDTKPTKNAVNVTIFTAMTNGEMAKAIEQEIKLCKEDFSGWGANERAEVETFLNGLKNAPDEEFIDPCYNTCPDSFVCAFGFINE